MKNTILWIILLGIWTVNISYVKTNVKEVCPESSGYIFEPFITEGAPEVYIDILTDFVFPCDGKLMAIDFYDSIGAPFEIASFHQQDEAVEEYTLMGSVPVNHDNLPGYYRRALDLSVKKGDLLGIFSMEGSLGILEYENAIIPQTKKHYNVVEVTHAVTLPTGVNGYYVAVDNKKKSYSIRVFYGDPSVEFTIPYNHTGCFNADLSDHPNIVQLIENTESDAWDELQDPIYKCYLKALNHGKTVFGLKERRCYVRANRNDDWIDSGNNTSGRCSPDGIGMGGFDAYYIHKDNNAAIGKLTFQSSETWIKESSQNALVKESNNHIDNCLFSLTSNEMNPYWMVFMEEEVEVSKLIITPTKDHPIKNFTIYIENEVCTSYDGEITTTHEVKCDTVINGRSVKIQMTSETPSQLALCYVEVHTNGNVTCTSRSGQLVSGGMYNVSDSQITASSVLSNLHEKQGPARARLDTIKRADLKGSWSADSNDVFQWIQADLGEVRTVTGVITQGSDNEDEWVSAYRFLYGITEETLEEYSTVLPGNNDRNTHVTNIIDPPVRARFVRINPKTWHVHISMRFDVIGCPHHQRSYCPALQYPPMGHTRISRMDGLHNGSIVQYECLPGNHYFSGEFQKTCVVHNSSAEWVGEDLLCRGCCDFEKTPNTVLVYNFNSVPLGPVDFLQGNATVQPEGQYIGLNTIPGDFLEIIDRIPHSGLNQTFCLEMWIDLLASNTTDKQIIIEVTNYFGLTITNTTGNIELLVYFSLTNHTNAYSMMLDTLEYLETQLLQLLITKDKNIIGLFVNGVQVFDIPIEDSQIRSLNEPRIGFVVSATGNVMLYSIRLQNTSCFDTTKYKNVQKQKRTGCENQDKSIELSCENGGMIVVHSVEVGQGDVINGVNYMCQFDFHYSCASVAKADTIKDKCDKQNECKVWYDDYTGLRPDTCDSRNNVTAMITYQCIREENLNPRNITTSPAEFSAANDLFPYETCVKISGKIEFNMGATSEIDEILIYFEVSTPLKLSDISVYAISSTDSEIYHCKTDVIAAHGTPVLYECGYVLGDRVAIEALGIVNPTICNVEIYSIIVQSPSETVPSITETAASTHESLPSTEATSHASNSTTTSTLSLPTSAESDTTTGKGEITNGTIQTTATIQTTKGAIQTSTGTTQTTATIQTTNRAIQTSNGTIQTTTESIQTTDGSSQILSTANQTNQPASSDASMSTTSPLVIYIRENINNKRVAEYRTVKRIEFQPSEAKYAAAVGIPVCVPPIIFISTIILLDLPKLIMDIRSALNNIIYGTKVKPKIRQVTPTCY